MNKDEISLIRVRGRNANLMRITLLLCSLLNEEENVRLLHFYLLPELCLCESESFEAKSICAPVNSSDCDLIRIIGV